MGRAGEGIWLLRLKRAVTFKRNGRLAEAGRPFFGTGGEVYFLTYVTLTPSGMLALSRFSEGFSTLTLIKDSQPSKAFSPILVTLFGIVMLFKEVQPMKASAPMLVTLSGIVMLVKEEQPTKAPALILVTLFGIVMLVKDLQASKALTPMLVTLSGIVMLVKDSQ